MDPMVALWLALNLVEKWKPSQLQLPFGPFGSPPDRLDSGAFAA
jgi:hypothetical protein